MGQRTATVTVNKKTKEELGELFDKLDKNHDGCITRSELIIAMRKESATLGPVLGLPAQKITQEGENRKKFEEFFRVSITPADLGQLYLLRWAPYCNSCVICMLLCTGVCGLNTV